MKMRVLFAAILCAASAIWAAEEPAPQPGPAESAPTAPSAALELDWLADLLNRHGLAFDPAAARRAALAAMVQSADPGGRWLNEQDRAALEDRLSGTAYEVGLRVRAATGGPKIIEVVADSPAAQAGLQVGDRLLAVNDADATALRERDLERLLRGTPDTRLRIRVLRGAETQEVETVTARLRQPSMAGAEDLPGGIGYLRLNGLYEGAAKEIIPALRGWDGTNYCGIILDIRGAGGTNLAAAADVARLFAPAGSLLFSVRTAQDQDVEVFRAPGGSVMECPVMILTDSDTEGAAEAMAAVFGHSLRGAMLLGHTTRGDPCVRRILSGPRGESVYLATHRLVMADGTVLDGRAGLEPDVVVNSLEEEYTYEPEPDARGRLAREEEEHRRLRERVRGDAALRRAADILLALKALNLRGPRFAPESP